MLRYLSKATEKMKNQETVNPPKEESVTPVNGPKEIKIQELPNRELKILF